MTSLALIFLMGLFMAAVSRRLHLPRIVGMPLALSILGVTGIEAAILGAVLGAVSPVVVVPRMVQLIESGYVEKSIPKLILSVAVLAILITAPLGALGMDISYRRLLSKR